ncbi:MAG: TRAP transporter substrate-binding protein [Balneolales bacterium]
MKRFYPFLVIIFLILYSGCGEIDKDVHTIRLAHGMNTTHPVHEAMLVMADLVTEKSGGQLEVIVYPNQQLGTERQLLELVQIGSIDITKVSSAVLENFVPEMQVFSLPYLIRDNEHAIRVLDGEIGRELLLAGEPNLLRGLTYYDSGKRSFYTKDRPIEAPSDLQGMRVRVMESQMAVNMIETMGGAPTPISFGELYTALQQGVVDGAENNLPSFLSTRHYEVARYLSMDEHTLLPDVLLIGTHSWEFLTEQEQTWIQEAADSSAIYQRKIWAEAEMEALRIVEEDGVHIIYPDKKPFMESTIPIYETLRISNPQLYQLAQRIRETE